MILREWESFLFRRLAGVEPALVPGSPPASQLLVLVTSLLLLARIGELRQFSEYFSDILK